MKFLSRGDSSIAYITPETDFEKHWLYNQFWDFDKRRTKDKYYKIEFDGSQLKFKRIPRKEMEKQGG